eukprot:scaffold706_cov190-Alexandrium_tamarense.AAC.17
MDWTGFYTLRLENKEQAWNKVKKTVFNLNDLPARVTFSEALRSFARILRGAHELAASDNSESYERSKITISTVAPDPSAFATLGSAPAALAWSVHAVDDSLRRQLVPTTKYSMEELQAGLVKALSLRSNKLRRTMLEVALMKDVPDDARLLSEFAMSIMKERSRRIMKYSILQNASVISQHTNHLTCLIHPTVTTFQWQFNSSTMATVEISASSNGKHATKATSRKTKSASLPQETVAYLKAWMMSPEHISHPYPTKQEKAVIMAETGIELKKLTNWFNNNRQSYWKPMVEMNNYMRNVFMMPPPPPPLQQFTLSVQQADYFAIPFENFQPTRIPPNGGQQSFYVTLKANGLQYADPSSGLALK